MLARIVHANLSVALATLALAPQATSQVVLEAYLKASNSTFDQAFGATVSSWGDTIVIGAPLESSGSSGVNGDQSDNSADDAGAVYVFVRNGTTWSQQAYLKASNAGASAQFGSSVALHADTLVVGAGFESNSATGVNGNQNASSATDSGAAYVFVRNGTTWTQQAYLKASNTDPGDFFGASVAVSNDTIVVGAWGEDSGASGVNGDDSDNSSIGCGAVYVFTRTGTTWSQEAYLKSGSPSPFDHFGWVVSVADDTLVAGVLLEDSDAVGVNGSDTNSNAVDSGAAYVFTRSGTTWSQQAYLKASNTGAADRFGHAASVSGDTVVIGALLEDGGTSGVNPNLQNDDVLSSGAAYVFVRNGTAWSQEAYIKASNVFGDDRFGGAVNLRGDTLLIAAPLNRSNSICANGDEFSTLGGFSGAAYLFDRVGSTWMQRAFLKASNTGTHDRFGTSLSLLNNLAVIGARFERSNATGVNGDQNDDSNPNSGAAYVFELNATTGLLPVAGSDLCSGDGGDQLGCTNCPCMNNAPAGTIGGCLNGAATSTRLVAEGYVSVGASWCRSDDLRFSISGAPPAAFCVLNSGDAVAPTNPANICFGMGSGTQAMPFDGLRCAVVNTRRHGGRAADINGEVGVTNNPWGGEGGPQVGIANAGPGFVGGQTRYFQVIHRDDALLSCMRGLNTSQAIEIMFTP